MISIELQAIALWLLHVLISYNSNIAGPYDILLLMCVFIVVAIMRI